MTSITFSEAGDRPIYTSLTETDFSETETDTVDLFYMLGAERDFDAGRGAPIARVFDSVRRSRGERESASEAASSRS